MEKGHVVEKGEVDQIFAAPAHPYTQKLLDAVKTARAAGVGQGPAGGECAGGAAGRGAGAAVRKARGLPATGHRDHAGGRWRFLRPAPGRGAGLPHQELAWKLVTKCGRARARAGKRNRLLLRSQSRTAALHGKAFAGQTFDRTVHKGDLTGIEIVNRLMEQVWARSGITRLEEHRARGARPGEGRRLHRRRAVRSISAPAPCRYVAAKAVLLATGGGPTMYRYHTPSGDKSMDGLAMALRLRPAPARHGDGAVPPDRPAGQSADTHDRHGTGGGPPRLGGYLLNGAKSASWPITIRRSSAHPQHRQPRHLRRNEGWPDHAQWRRVHHDGASRPGKGRQTVQGHGRPLPRLRLRSGRRAR